MQQWLMQTVQLTADSLRVVGNQYTAYPAGGGIAPTFPGRSIGQLRPNFRVTDVVCTDIGYVAWARIVDWTAIPPLDLNFLLEVRSYDGRLIYLGNNPAGVPALARVVAAWRDHVVFASNEDVPELFVTKITVH